MCEREREGTAGLFREPQHRGRHPPTPPQTSQGRFCSWTSQVSPREPENSPCPAPHTYSVTQLVNTSHSVSVGEKEGHVRGQRASLLLPQAPTSSGSTLHRGS